MVEYNSDDSALTLGDDDSIAVGDYRIQYSSANDRFEVEHPNGELSDVPRSTSGSLVPQGLAESVAAGEALADDGNTYSSVQDAVNAASGWVFVGPGTFNESVTISTAGLTLEGSGYDTVINGGTNDVITVSAENVSVSDLSVADGGNGIVVNFANCSISNVIADEPNTTGTISSLVQVEGDNCKVSNCVGIEVTWVVNVGDSTNTQNAIITNCFADTCFRSYELDDNSEDCIIANCISTNDSDNGIRVNTVDHIVIGNRVSGSGNDGIQLDGATDCIVANNRVSDSTNQDIDDNGTGTVLDGNLTGPSN